jgi:hypothetical protein
MYRNLFVTKYVILNTYFKEKMWKKAKLNHSGLSVQQINNLFRDILSVTKVLQYYFLRE